MKVRLLETVRTVVGLRDAGIVDLPKAEALRLIEDGKAVMVSPSPMSPHGQSSFSRENRMIKSFIKS